ncbi:aldose epimerase family protein [Peribacillus sp. JNUCC 23]
MNHSLNIKSDKFLELDQELIPNGQFLEVENTPFDFRRERLIKTGVASDHPQNLLVGEGYDHPFLLNTNNDQEIVLMDVESGRTLTVETDEVGVVVYSGNSLKEEGEFNGVPSRKYLDICLETQGLPDAVHHTHFPSVILDKRENYSSVTKYRFGVQGDKEDILEN